MELNGVVNELQHVAMSLTDDELLDLIDEVKCIYERFSDITDARMDDQQ
jgi:hypothetical protein